MQRVVAYDDVKAGQRNSPSGGLLTEYLSHSAANPNAPRAFISEGGPGRHIVPHWHIADQFQLITAGHGYIGRHELLPYSLHFARAYTPYGPLRDDGVVGFSFYTLRARFDAGAMYLPASKDKLAMIEGRHPWQVSSQAVFAERPGVLREVPGISNDEGLAAYTLSLASGERMAAPAPAGGDGQYIIVTEGTLRHGGREHRAHVVIFSDSTDPAFMLEAGHEGLKAIIMNYPRPHRAARSTPTGGFLTMQCGLCDFVYDEKVGLPYDGIAPGTKWADIPDHWTCPDCGASKTDFHSIRPAS